MNRERILSYFIVSAFGLVYIFMPYDLLVDLKIDFGLRPGFLLLFGIILVIIGIYYLFMPQKPIKKPVKKPTKKKGRSVSRKRKKTRQKK